MYSRVVRVTKEIVKKGISVGICLAMLLPILPLNFSFIINTEKEASAAPITADNIGCKQVGYWGLKYDGTSKKDNSYWEIIVYNKNIGSVSGRLVKGEDYDIEWPEDMTNVGTKTYTVVLKNNYTGTLTGTVGIVKREIIITADNQTIDYGEQLPQLTWKQSGDSFLQGDSLIEGTVAVEKNENYPRSGEYNIVPSGFSTNEPNNYEVSHVNGKLTINGPSADNVTMSLNQSSFPFNGRRQNLIVTVKDGNDILKENVHYALNVIGDLINVGQGRAEVTLQAPYPTKTLTKDWSITKRNVNVKIDDKCKVQGEDDPTFTYTVTAVDNGEIIDGVDLALTRDSGNDLGGSYTIRLASTSNSNVNIVNTTNGTLKIGTDTFEITPRDISNATMTVTPTSGVYTGGAHTPSVVLKDILNSVTQTLTKDKDYTLTWPNDMTNVGQKQGTITGKGNYTGTTNADYEITGASTDNISVVLTPNSFGFNGWYQDLPTVEVYDGSTKLSSSDYSVEFPALADRVSVGEKTVTVTLGAKYNNKKITGKYEITPIEPIEAAAGKQVKDYLPRTKLEEMFGKLKIVDGDREGTDIPGFWYWREPDGYYCFNEGIFLVGDVTTGDETRTHYAVYCVDNNDPDYFYVYSKYIQNSGLGVPRMNTGEYCLPVAIPFKVSQGTITADMVTMTKTGTYTGSEITPDITVKDGSTTLELDKDYTVSYEGDRVNVGSFKVIVTGKGNYSGTVTKTYAITAPTSGNVGVTLSDNSFTYNGGKQTPTVTKVTFNGADVPSSEYTASIPTTSTNADTYTVTVTLSANYGSKTGTATYTINRKPVTVTAANKSQVYGESAQTLTYTTNTGDTLNGDLTRASGNNVGTYDINQGTVTNANNSNYDITYVKGTYTITAAPITDSAVTLSSSSFTYDGSEKKPTVTVKVGGRTLTADTDYTIVWPTNPVAVSNSYAIKVTGKGNYSGTVTKTYAITAPTSGNVAVTLSKGSFTYNGSNQTPTVTKVTFNGAEVPSSEYTASIPTTSTNADTYTVTVTLSANYGSKTGTATYTINRKPVTVTAANKSQVYGESAQTLTYTTNTGDTLNGDLTRASGNNVGTYDINQGTVTNANNSNYDITYVKGTYTITAAPITDSAVTLSSSSFTYDGSEKKPTVTVKVGGRTLTANTDYKLEFDSDTISARTVTLKVKGQNNYSGEVTKTYTIARKTVSDSTTDSKLRVTTGSTTFTYNGSQQKLEVQITYNGETWQEGVDYTKEYLDSNNGNDITNQGTKTLRVTFIKNLDGTITKTYTINPLSITDSKVSFVLDPPSAVFTGSALTTEAKGTVTFSGTRKDLVKGTDFEFNCPSNLINKGDYTLEITGKGNYSDTLNKIFSITAASSDDGNISADLDNAEVTYNGGEQKVGVTVKEKVGSGTRTLQENVDYTKSYKDASGGNDLTNVGTKTVTITLQGNYSGTITKTYRITQRDITSDSDFVVTVSPTSSVYTGVAHTPTLTAKYKNVPLTEGSNKDYTKVITGNMTDKGEHTYTVTGQGNFKGSKTVTYTITQRPVSDSTSESELDIKLSETAPVYSKEEKRPTVTAKTILNGKTINLSQGTDFTVSYKDIDNGSDLTNVGRKKAIITFINNLSGTVTREYTIVARDITSDHDFTVAVNPESSGYTGVAHTPTLTAKYKNVPLTEGSNRDYTKIITGNMTDQGEHTYTVTGQGNFKGSKTVTYTITQRSVSDSTPEGELDIKLSETEPVYSKEEKRPTVTAKTILNGKTINLSQGTDFTVSYKDINNGSDLTNVGRKKAIITFINNLSGTVTKEYTIVARDITSDNDFVVTVSPTSSVYTRSKHTPTITVKYKNAPVATDDWSHSSSEDMISAKLNILTIAGKRNFKGSKTVNYTITPKPITVTADSPSIYYGDSVPTLTVQKPDLVAGDSLSGSLKIKQTGKNGKTYPNADEYEIIEDEPFANPNYTITFKPGTFTIKPRAVSDGVPNGITMTLNPETTEFNGERQLPKETLNDTKTGHKLIKGQDYDLEYLTNMTDAITHKIKANLKGNYSGSKTADFIITPKQISDNTPESELKVDVDKTGYTDETGYTYDKTPKKPAVTIKAMFGNRTMSLTQGTHFDVNYLAENGTSDVTNVGPKKVVITFKKDFSGTKTIKYAINRRDVTIRANERRRYYKTPDPDMRPRTDYDTINGLITGDNLYGSFEREDPTNEEVGRYKIIQGRTLTNANNPNYNIIFDAENSGYFIIEVDKSSWGTPQDDPKDHYVDDEGKTSVEVDKYGMVWLKETSDGTSAWYGIDNSKGVFRIGSRFWVMWLSEKESPETYKKYWDMLDEDHKRAMESINGWIFLIGVTDPDGKEYKNFSEDDEEKAVPTYVQIGDDWDEDELVGVFISETEDEDIVTTFVNNFEFPEGLDTFGKMMLRHFSPYFIYDEFTDAERKALEGNDDEANILRTTVDIKGKTVQIIVSGPRKVLPTGTKLIAIEDRNDNTCKIWLVDQSGKELPSPLSERVEVFIEMVDGMEDLIEVRLPKIGEDFHYGKFDGSWYGAIYTPYFPISLSLDELTDAEKDELNKKRGITGDLGEGPGHNSASENGSKNRGLTHEAEAAENDGQGDNETEKLQPAENGSLNWWQNLSRTQIICLTAAGILLLLLLIFLILLILKRRKEKENSSQQ